MPSPFRSALALSLFVGATVVGLALDLGSKWLAFDSPWKLASRVEQFDGRWFAFGADTREVHAIPYVLHLRATVNEGAVFGIGQGKQLVFVAVSVLATVFLAFLFGKSRSKLEQVLLGLLLAGVLGNMIDRVAYNYVRDFLFLLPTTSWPGTWNLGNYPGTGPRLVFPYIFNVADVLLCCGVAVLLLRNLLPEKKPEATRAEA
ncbi:MAG: signal peptidase II [Tepidisphaeraceae bacterium]